MRLTLVLLGFCCLAGPVQALEARTPRASGAALEAARRYLCPNGGTPQRAARGQAGGRCVRGGGMEANDPAVRDWDRGIAPASRAQRPCPPGTRADEARANPGVTRCIPS